MQTESAQTGFMMKGFTQKGDPDIAYYRKGSAASQISTHDIDGLDLSGCERLHVTGIFPAVSPSALAATKRLISRAKALELPISFDPNLRPQLWESQEKMVATLNDLAQGVETILPGIGEGKILTGQDTPEGVAAFYHQRGVKKSGPSKSPTAAITRACPPGSASPRLSWRASPKGGGLWNGRRSSPTWTTPC